MSADHHTAAHTDSAFGPRPGSMAGESCFAAPDGSMIWQVNATCSGHRILTWAHSPRAARAAADRLLARIPETYT